MTKADLVEAVYRIHGGLSRKEAADVVEQLIDSIKHTDPDLKMPDKAPVTSRASRSRTSASSRGAGDPAAIAALRDLAAPSSSGEKSNA